MCQRRPQRLFRNARIIALEELCRHDDEGGILRLIGSCK